MLYKGGVNGDPFTDYGIIEQLDAPNLYSYQYWSNNHGTERVKENFISITYKLESVGKTTLLSMIQSNIKSLELYVLMNTQVWDFLLDSLKKYLEARS